MLGGGYLLSYLLNEGIVLAGKSWIGNQETSSHLSGYNAVVSVFVTRILALQKQYFVSAVQQKNMNVCDQSESGGGFIHAWPTHPAYKGFIRITHNPSMPNTPLSSD